MITELVETDWYKTFNISDHHFKGEAKNWTFDAMDEDLYGETKDATTSWVLSGSKSYKECEASAEAGSTDAQLSKATPPSENNK